MTAEILQMLFVTRMKKRKKFDLMNSLGSFLFSMICRHFEDGVLFTEDNIKSLFEDSLCDIKNIWHE